MGYGLVHNGELKPTRFLVVENLDLDYLAFEEAGRLLREGWGERVLVPVLTSGVRDLPWGTYLDVINVMAKAACLPSVEIVPVAYKEPLTLNVAVQVRERLQQDGADSVIVISPGFRSKRAYLVWDKAMRPFGIATYVVPVFGKRTPENWHKTWHGRQEVVLQWMKLIYYHVFLVVQ